MSTTSTALRGAGAVLALATAVVHLLLVPEHLEEKLYIGVLFLIGSVLLVLAVVALAAGPLVRVGWALGSLVSAGMVLGYVLSRTTGLPDGYKEGWGEPVGTLSLVLELLFLVVAAVAVRGRTTRGAHAGAVGASTARP